MSNIIKAGEYKIFKDYYNKDNFLFEINSLILESISLIAGQKISNLVFKNGLKKLHLYFNPDYLPFLQNLLSKKIDLILRKQIFNTSLYNLKYEKFFIDAKTNYRIIYPFVYGKKSTLGRSQYLMINLENYKDPDKELNIAKKKSLKNILNIESKKKIAYFRNLPVSCYGHGPHRDTWFGHTFNAFNLWWSITGVNKRSGLLIFPEVNKHNLSHLDEPAYVNQNQYLGSSKVIHLNDGELLVFDPEILHATRLNTSKETRIVFSGRINENKPVFYKHTKAVEYKDWYYSEDFKKNEFTKKHFFLRKNNLFKKKTNKTLKPKKNFKEIFINKKLTIFNNYKIIKINKIQKNLLYKINFINASLGMKMLNNKVKIFQSNCPHLSINILDGYSKNEKITCPGHGLMFNLKSGKSDCKSFNLKIYKIFCDKKFIFLKT